MQYKSNPEFKVRVFIYADHFGIDVDQEYDEETETVTLPEGILNSPYDEGQLGMVFDPSCVLIAPEALEAIKKAPREGGSFAPLMVGDNMFAFMGGSKCCWKVSEIAISRDCRPDLLKATEGIEAPEDFKEYVDTLSPHD